MFIVIVDNVVPIPIAESINDNGFMTNFLILSLYFKLKVWILFDFMCNLKLSFKLSPCCCPDVVAVATVTVPFIFLKDPDILFVINSILISSWDIDPVLVKTSLKNKKYTLIGYKGKQVRDNIHSNDLVNCFWEYYKKPKKGVVYNIGGGRYSNCSILEAISEIEQISKIKIKKNIVKENRVGDHIWYISDNKKFKKDYPNWKQKYNTNKIIRELIFNS